MHLKQVFITKRYTGGYAGSAEFTHDLGEVKLTLLPEHVDLILHACSEALIKSSQKVADEMCADVIDYFEVARLQANESEDKD